ncbi:MAG: MBL fold metallo-hydrolase [Ilumatobacteraceae bacterium]
MKVTLLGTGSPIPNPDRAGAATLLESGTQRLLVDAGRGVVMRMSAAGVLPVMLTGVVITHLHSDHITDLNDVITTHWIMTANDTPLRIYGPIGIDRVVQGILDVLEPDISYRLEHHQDTLTWRPHVEVTEVAPGDEFRLDELRVIVGRTNHQPVEPTVGYRVKHEDKSVVFGGDGIPCAELDQLCLGADAYVQTVMRDDLVRQVPSKRFLDVLDYHSTVEQAAQTAARAGVSTFVMTHYIPGMQSGQEDEWREIAARHFTGTIVLGDDLTSTTL